MISKSVILADNCLGKQILWDRKKLIFKNLKNKELWVKLKIQIKEFLILRIKISHTRSYMKNHQNKWKHWMNKFLKRMKIFSKKIWKNSNWEIRFFKLKKRWMKHLEEEKLLLKKSLILYSLWKISIDTYSDFQCTLFEI